MSESQDNEVRTFLLGFLEEQFAIKGFSAEDISDDFDLLIQGTVDSLGFLEMTLALQEEFEMEIDFEEVDPEQLCIVGPLCQYVNSKRMDRQ
jgi:acyl carrier protein